MNRLTKALRSIAIRLKGLTINFAGGASSLLLSLRSNFNYAREVGDGTGSSIVMAVVNWICRTFPEAPILVERRGADGQYEPVPDHALLELLERPNRFYSGILLWMATLLDWVTSGNAYWLKLRNESGRVVELWWAPARYMEPRWPMDGSAYITHYEYSPGGLPLRIEVSDVVHFRHGLDPANTRKGLSPLGSLLREIFTDEEAANYSAAMLKNMGVPPVILSPEGEGFISTDDATALKEDYIAKTSGDNRGQPIVIPSSLKVQVLSFDPQKMDLKSLRRLPEERVSAVLGLPAIVAGLGAGLDRSTFANMAEAREAAYESNIIPTQRLFGAELKSQLLPDFERDTRRIRISFDLSGIRVLQEDQNKLWMRMDVAVKGGWAMVSEARRAVGLPVEPEHDVYLRTFSVEAIPKGQLAAPKPEPEPAPLFLPSPPDDEETPRPEGDDEPPPPDGGKGAGKAGTKAFTASVKEKIGETFVKRLDPKEKAFRAMMAAYFEGQAERLVARLDSDSGKVFTRAEAKDVMENLFDWAAEAGRLSKAARPLVQRYLEQAAEEAIADYALGISFDLANPRVTKWVGDRLKTFSKAVNDTTKADIAAQLREAEAAGESIPQMMDRIKGYYGGVDYRAERTARTEVVGASNRGAMEAYQQAGVSKKEWLATADDRTREDHLEADGQVVGVDEPFDVGGEDIMQPGEGSPEQAINCRCTVLPVVE